MRVNVYGEELTSRIELITKTVVEEETGEEFEFYGIRFWLKFPNQPWWIHRKVNEDEDDDSSAITLWSSSKDHLKGMMVEALMVIDPENVKLGNTES